MGKRASQGLRDADWPAPGSLHGEGRRGVNPTRTVQELEKQRGVRGCRGDFLTPRIPPARVGDSADGGETMDFDWEQEMRNLRRTENILALKIALVTLVGLILLIIQWVFG